MWCSLLQTFASRFVLEVLGSVGAVWGPAEAVGLRTSDNNWFWKTLAMTVGMIFFVRWCFQLFDAIRLEMNGDKESCQGSRKKEDVTKEEDVLHLLQEGNSTTATMSNDADALEYGSTTEDDVQLEFSNRSKGS